METYSEGAGGATGVRARIDVCAVVDCEDSARPHTCFYDKRRHRHGAIHYDDAKTELKFREGAWYWLCDKHYQQLEIEWNTYEIKKVIDAPYR